MIFLANIENKLSDFVEISFGVPQGSILGLLLFLIYVIDMPQAVTSTLPLYAMIHVSYTNIRTSCKLKNDSIKILKIFVTGLLITN